MDRINDMTLPLVIDYVRKDLEKGLYIYLDLTKYGVRSNYIRVWADNAGDPGIVIMTYNRGAHVFSIANSFKSREIADFINKLDIDLLTGSEETVRLLAPLLVGEKPVFGYVAKFRKSVIAEKPCLVTDAEFSDLHEVASLVCSDAGIGGHYEVDNLRSEFEKRKLDGYGRNKVIKLDGKIVAHAGTYAEVDGMSIIGGVITDVSVRGKGYARMVVSSLIDELSKEHHDIYLFLYSDELLSFYGRLGFEVCDRVGKIKMRK